MRTIIIEDETRSLNHVMGMLAKHFTQVEVVGTAANAKEAIEKINALQPELLLLDIQLPDKNGFEMLTALGKYHFEVIFITAHHEYAIQALKLCALDYILKPVSLEDLSIAINKAITKKKYNETQAQLANLLDMMSRQDKKEHCICLPLMHEKCIVAIKNIVRIEAVKNYAMFHINDKRKLMVTRGLYEYAAILEAYDFMRTSKAELVNMQYVKSLLKKDAIYDLLLLNGEKVHVSRMKLDAVKERIERMK